jgi:hypothetical protein
MHDGKSRTCYAGTWIRCKSMDTLRVSVARSSYLHEDGCIKELEISSEKCKKKRKKKDFVKKKVARDKNADEL